MRLSFVLLILPYSALTIFADVTFDFHEVRGREASASNLALLQAQGLEKIQLS